MRKIKLSGREIAVLRAIDFADSTPGDDILVTSRLAREDAIDVLNGLIDVGYVECFPIQEQVTLEQFASTRFEVNPSYAMLLREAMVHRF